MLTQYRILLMPDQPCRPRAEWAYRLYAALLERAPATFGELVHEMTVSPVSQYLDCREDRLLWTVILLGSEAENALGPVLEAQEPIFLNKDHVTLKLTSERTVRVADVEELLVSSATAGERHVLDFRTPTAFKSRGKYLILPTSRLILQSLIKKWNGSFPDCPIEDEDGEGLDALADGVLCRRYSLRDRTYFLKGNAVPGFVGTLTLENRLRGFQRQLTDALLAFSGYSGVGIKTSLGMGGVEHHLESKP